MPSAARSTDTVIGVCPCHKSPKPYTAVWVANTTVMANGLSRVNMGSMAISDCGHPVVPISGSSTVMIQGLPAHRMGDQAMNCGMGVTSTGSPNVITGD